MAGSNDASYLPRACLNKQIQYLHCDFVISNYNGLTVAVLFCYA